MRERSMWMEGMKWTPNMGNIYIYQNCSQKKGNERKKIRIL
jgi:hypothetical protein